MGRFQLRRIDPDTDSFTEQSHFETADDTAVERLLELDGFAPLCSWRCDHDDYLKLAAHVGLPPDVAPGLWEIAYLGARPPFDPASHTGRELLLMLQGKKPFAAFSDALESEPDDRIIPRGFFEPHVKAGRIRTVEYIESYRHIRIRQVLYALPGEEWRFNAYRMMWDLANKHGWNVGFERVEGYLLGYETEIDGFHSKAE